MVFSSSENILFYLLILNLILICENYWNFFKIGMVHSVHRHIDLHIGRLLMPDNVGLFRIAVRNCNTFSRYSSMIRSCNVVDANNLHIFTKLFASLSGISAATFSPGDLKSCTCIEQFVQLNDVDSMALSSLMKRQKHITVIETMKKTVTSM